MTVIDGVFSGLVIGLVWSLPSCVATLLYPGKNLPLLVDIQKAGKKIIPQGEIFWWSMFLHLALAIFFGGLYPLLVSAHLFSSYALPSLLLYALGFFLFVGLVALPLVGLGVFAKKEGHFVWMELLLTHLLYSLSYWYVASHILLP